MTADQVREAMHTQPFRPFQVRLADGRSFHVKHPDFVAVSYRGRGLTLNDEEGVHLIDMRLVAELVIPEPETSSH